MSWTPVEVLQEAIVQCNIKIHRHRSSRFVWTMVRGLCIVKNQGRGQCALKNDDRGTWGSQTMKV